mmetsp:Transcript_2460/g.5726  ORF Transcript_2460/g.5726 Transcript_2460/m.5726 type:complete len:80 (-) Transcript_2460:698-937(-)
MQWSQFSHELLSAVDFPQKKEVNAEPFRSATSQQMKVSAFVSIPTLASVSWTKDLVQTTNLSMENSISNELNLFFDLPS